MSALAEEFAGFTESGDLDTSQVRRGAKTQALGRQLVSTLYMLIRNVKLHSPDNEVFIRPIDILRETIGRIIAVERHMNLQAADTSVYLNGIQIRLDFTALASVRYLTREFEQRDIGGLSTNRPVSSQEIRDFLFLFSSSFDGEINEDGAEGREFSSLRLAKYSKVRELLDKLEADETFEKQIDRKKYLLTVYARSVFFMRKNFERMQRDGSMLPQHKAGRLVQELIELCFDVRAHFLGVTTTRAVVEYLPYHSVNTCLLAVVFGNELGLDKRQLHELGLAALYSAVGMATVPERIVGKTERLTEEDRRFIDLYPLRSANRVLAARGLDMSTMMRVVATYESKIDFALPKKDDTGEIQLVTPKVGLGVFGRIIAICDTYDALTSKRPFREAYGPEIALALMSSELKYRFDPGLLRVFMKVMSIAPVKILGEGQAELRIA